MIRLPRKGRMQKQTRIHADRILVAGAGPAGLSCAYWASKEGHRVTVFEKERELGAKPCGELIPEEALRYTSFGKKSPWILNRVKRCLLYYKSRYIREVRAPKSWSLPIAPLRGYTIDKTAFLRELRDASESLGANVHLRRKLCLPDAQVKEFDIIVDATGYLRNLGRAAEIGHTSGGLAVCARSYRKGTLDHDAMVLNFLDKGYSWLIPHGDLVNFGVGGFYDKGSLEKLIEKNIKIFDLRPATGAPPLKTSPEFLGGPLEKLKEGKLVIAGEAAGAVMPTTGEGIRFALWNGSICFRKDYEKLFWRGYGSRLKFGRNLLKLVLRMSEKERLDILEHASPEMLSAFADGARPRIRDLARFPWLLRHLARF